MLVKVGTEIVAVSPWSPMVGSGFGRLNEGRSVWLAERGLTGGVRTFRSPVLRGADDAPSDAEEIFPSGWFRVPADVPRGRSVEHVRYSTPPGMNPVLAARLGGGAALATTRAD